MLPDLEMSYLNALMPGSNCSTARFISHSKFVLNHLHQEKGQKFANRAVINIYFNSKRKLSTDSVMKDKVKTPKKDKKKNNFKEP